MKKLFAVIAGIILAGAVVYQPLLLVVLGGVAFVGMIVYAIGVATNGNHS